MVALWFTAGQEGLTLTSTAEALTKVMIRQIEQSVWRFYLSNFVDDMNRLGYQLGMSCPSEQRTQMQLLSDDSVALPLPEKRKHHRRPMAPSEAVRLERRREQFRAFYHRNKAERQAYAKEHQAKKRAEKKATETPDQIEARRQWHRKYYAETHSERRAKINAYLAKNRERFRPKRSERRRVWLRQRRIEDPAFRIVNLLRARLYIAIRRARVKKSMSSLILVGCNPTYLLHHIQSQWLDGMNWKNFGNGNGRWNIDHIKPCSAFNLLNAGEQQVCFHYSNLRPLWWRDNAAKSSQWEGRYWKHSDHACVSPVEESASCSDKV